MSNPREPLTRAADVLVDCLEAFGVTATFGVPGESYLAVLDTLYDRALPFIICRQEGGATMAAEAHARVTGGLGVAMVTRGPGLTNASAGLHVAFQTSTPLLLLVGMPALATEGREAFQEMDVVGFSRAVAKDAVVIRDAARMAEQLTAAARTALTGRPGPVVLGLPEDMLTAPAPPFAMGRPALPRSAPAPSDVAAAAATIAAAERPLIIAGGAGWSADASRALAVFVAKTGAPVAAAWRRQDTFDNADPAYAGHLGLGADPSLKAMVEGADCLIVAAARLGENTTQGYTLIAPPSPKVPLIHIHPDPAELGAVHAPAHPLAGDPALALAALCEHNLGNAGARKTWQAKGRAAYTAFSEPPQDVGPVQMGQIVRHISRTVPAGTRMANGAGNYAIWLHRFFTYRTFGQQLAPTSGSMGYGLPAAIGAAVADPKTPVVAFAGDGCALMTIQELATLAERAAPVIVIVVDNGRYGTIAMHQQRDFPGRAVGTAMKSPDFAAVARGFGIAAETVRETSAFAGIFDRMLAAQAPGLIHIVADPRAIRPGVTAQE
ncbi:MAG: thiamine pyrophosphate-dependent enzyme [Pseudomonadota bacterium]